MLVTALERIVKEVYLLLLLRALEDLMLFTFNVAVAVAAIDTIAVVVSIAIVGTYFALGVAAAQI